MADELIDVFSEMNEPTGTTMMKSEVHRKGLWHRAAHVAVYTSRGELLIQLRAASKNFFPNVWDISAAGHVGAGEEPINTAVRELEEEIGLPVQATNLELYTVAKRQQVYNEIINNEYEYVYLLRYDQPITTLKLQKEEVARIRFVPVDALLKEVEEHTENFVPPTEYWMEIVDRVKNRIVENS